MRVKGTKGFTPSLTFGQCSGFVPPPLAVEENGVIFYRARSRRTTATGKESKFSAGFTLLELLVVIAIIGILAAMVFVAFNISETLGKTRDAQRFSDLRALHTALAFYTATFPEKQFCDPQLVYLTIPSETSLASCSPVSGFTGWAQVAKAALKNVDGNGWLPINFDEVPGKSPVGFLPVDPRNTLSGSCPDPNASSPDYYYRFVCNISEATWEFDARLESKKYRDIEDRDGTDGGNHSERYELGRDTKLLPADE